MHETNLSCVPNFYLAGLKPALTLNGYNFLKIKSNAAKLGEFIYNFSGKNLTGYDIVLRT